MSTPFDEITVPEKSEAAVEEPREEQPSTSPTDAQPSEPVQPSPQEAATEQPSGQAAGVEEQGKEQTTEINLTGLEKPEDLQARHGDSWAIKTARKHLEMVKEAGGTPLLRQGAQLIATIQDPQTTGAKFTEVVAPIMGARWPGIRNEIFWSTLDESEENKESVLRDILKRPDLTLSFVEQAIENELKFSGDTPAVDEEDTSELPAAIQEKLRAYDDLMKKFPEMEKRVTGFEQQQATTRQQQMEEQVNQLGRKLYESVFSVVEERKSKLGLDDLPTDSEEVKDIKADLRDYLSEDKLVAAFESNPDGMRFAQQAIAYVKRMDEQNAFSYRDRMAVVAEMSLEQALKSPRVARKLAQLKSQLESQSTPRNPNARTEVVQGAPAAVIPSDPFDEGAKAGLNPFDVSVQLAGQGQRVSR